MDHRGQPSYVAAFGVESFLLSDAMDRERLRDLLANSRPEHAIIADGSPYFAEAEAFDALSHQLL